MQASERAEMEYMFNASSSGMVNTGYLKVTDFSFMVNTGCQKVTKLRQKFERFSKDTKFLCGAPQVW